MTDESLNEFAMRLAGETGYDDRPQSIEWLQAKAARIEEATKAFCHYRNGGSGFNSCCMNGPRCREAIAAAARIKFGTKARLASPEPAGSPATTEIPTK
jgi:hypothetical protein